MRTFSIAQQADPQRLQNFLTKQGITASVVSSPNGMDITVDDAEFEIAAQLVRSWSPVPQPVADAAALFKAFDQANPTSLTQAQMIALLDAAWVLFRFLYRSLEDE